MTDRSTGRLGRGTNPWTVRNSRSLLLGTVALAVLGAACAGQSRSGDEGSDTPSGVGGAISVGIGSGGNPGVSSAGTGTSTAPQVLCGDGRLGSGEACDDGNVTAGDGCTSDCSTVEEGFACPSPGKACVPAQVCGDKKIGGSENCDDGNAESRDGCSSTCRIESGWSCPFLGARCHAAACGDGIIAGQESCDDGQDPSVSGDGCSETCTLEAPEATEMDAWVCPEPGAPCRHTKCGDGVQEGTEQCDDGNNDTADGCTPACRKEPQCPASGGACTSVCGDAMILSTDTDQQCDDGNNADGDGCSADCKLEPGFQCKGEAAASDKLILPVVLRDFRGKAEPNGHPDFENYNKGFERGIVQDQLDSAGKPQHVTSNKSNTENAYSSGMLTSAADYFSKWYRDDPDFNKTVTQTLTLTRLSTGEFKYSNTSFFPLTGLGWGNYASTGKNFHFTSEVRYWFEYRGNETLQFKGDDDVWVFVNKRLAVDLGGVHGAIDGSVVLDTANGSGTVCENAALNCSSPRSVQLGLEPGKVYEIVVFQAERHTSASNYTLTLSAFSSTRSTCRSVCGDGIVTPDEACDLGAAKNTGAYGTCTANCRLPSFCGDGTVDTESGEVCDDGVNLATYGYNSTAACNPSCQWTDYCGDGRIDSLFGEQCDDGNHVNGDGCEANCTTRTGCGDGHLDSTELCDDGNTRSGDGCSEFCTTETILF